MFKFRKILSLGLAVTLCMTMSLPVMARGNVCSKCGSSNLEVYGDEQSYESRIESCVHGYEKSTDRVEYLVHRDMLYCHDCHHTMTSLYPRKEEMRRMCQWARSVLTVAEGVWR